MFMETLFDVIRTKMILTEIAEYEHMPLEEYDLGEFVFYETTGSDMVGYNVDYYNETNESCWVMDDKYFILEIPSYKNDRHNYFGTFLMIAFNNDFEYFIAGFMRVRQNEVNQIRLVSYKIMGQYSETPISDELEIDIIKNEIGSNFTPGTKSSNLDFKVKMENRIAAYLKE